MAGPQPERPPPHPPPRQASQQAQHPQAEQKHPQVELREFTP